MTHRLTVRALSGAMMFIGMTYVSGCSASSSSPSNDAGLSDAQPSKDAGHDAGVCNMLAQSGADITAVGDPSDLPAGVGGTFSDGLYVMTAVKLHQFVATFTREVGALTIKLTGPDMMMVSTSNSVTNYTNFRLSTIGADFKLVQTCSDGSTSTLSFDSGTFSVEGNTVRLFVTVTVIGLKVQTELIFGKQ